MYVKYIYTQSVEDIHTFYFFYFIFFLTKDARCDTMNTDEATITGMDINIEWQCRPLDISIRPPKQISSEGTKNKKLKKA